MNLLLLHPEQYQNGIWTVENPRQIQHLHQVLHVQAGDELKVGVLNGERFLAKIIALTVDKVQLIPQQQSTSFSPQSPAKLPITLLLALPRPKVLTRLIQDSVAMGVEKIVLLNSYFVDKSYWSSPAVQQINDAVYLGLEQAQDTQAPEIILAKRFKPFVEDVLSQWATQQPIYVAHPYATEKMPTAIQHSCGLVIGCERGFIPYEIELLKQNGCEIRTLGQRILRTENSVAYCLGRLFSN